MGSTGENATRAQMERICREVVHGVGCTRASVWMFAPDLQAITCLCVLDTWQQSVQHGTMLLRADHQAYFHAMLADLKVMAPHARTHPATRSFTHAYFEPLDIHSLLDVVVVHGDVPLGILCCEHSGEPRTWTHADVEHLRQLGGRAAEFLLAARG